MAVLIGQASIDERGKISGGVAGNQTGRELNIRSYYAKAWKYVLRCKNPSKAEMMAKSCEYACKNMYIGYDQSQRNTLRTQAMKAQWDLSKISKYCECDCSSLVSVCAESAGIAIPYSGGNAPATSNMVKAFSSTGEFDVLSESKYLTSDKYLKRGDILVKTGHTVMVLGNGSGASTVPTTQKTSSTKYIVGKIYTLDSNLYIREQPFGEKIKYSCITANAQKHAEFDAYGCAILQKGTEVTCKAVKELTDSTWILIPSGWICAIEAGKVYIK